MRPWLKAGLIGGVALAVLTIISSFIMFLSPVVQSLLSCCTCGGMMILYPAIGVLAGAWLPPPRTVERGAKEGALAGLVAGILDGAVTLLAGGASILLGASQAYLSELPPEILLILRETSTEGLLSPGGLFAAIAGGVPCCVIWAVACGALGGLVCAAVWKE